MTNKKISALTGASTPLAGTEVLPIVQSGSTVKVSVANLTLGRDVAMDNATVNGHVTVLAGDVRFDDERFVYSYAGGTVGQFMSGTYYDGGGLTQRVFLNNAEVGRWTGTDLQVKLGNFVPATAAKGINFTANTPAAGMTSQLLNWYEEGTWTPNQGAGLTVVGAFTSNGTYVRTGRSVTVKGQVLGATTVAVSATGVMTSNLPFTAASGHAGSMYDATITVGGIVGVTGTSVTAATAIAASASITFTATYQM